MLFSSKPYHIDDCLDASTPSRAAEQPIEYHINHHTQSCSCGRSNCWSELTLVSFHHARKTKIIAAAPSVEYNIPVFIHNLAHEQLSICFFCAPFKSHADLPVPKTPAPERAAALGWRTISKPTPTKTKKEVTDDDLLA